MGGIESPREPVRHTSAGNPTATLDEVDIRSQLQSRPSRPANYETEDQALRVLAREMAQNPRDMLQTIVEMALDLCNADTAGISLLEGDVFQWEALAGTFGAYRHSTMPRDASPCGICIERDATQLMHLPDRCFPALRTEPLFVESLLIPFHNHGKAIGTVWVVSHSFERKFDREDERIVGVLAHFASAGWQLWKAGEAAAEADHRKDEFLAMLGHELRNPLAAISSAASVLQKVVAAEPSIKHASHAVDIVARQARQVTRMIDDLLDVSRISNGKLQLRTKSIELQTVVADAIEATRSQIERRRHQLSVDLPTAPIILEADPSRLAQLLTNLIDNAAKYTPDGGRIWLSADVAKGALQIVIRDTGIGIRPEHLTSIFDLFTQVDGPLDRAGGGLGLGLTVVRQLVEMHGGSVEAHSEGPGKGSRFTIRLPLPVSTVETGSRARRDAAHAEPPARRRILVVEDDDDVANSLATSLTLDGHTVKIVPDGPAALEALRAFDPDLVLLDVGLPGMSGHDVARKIRSSVARADLVIVALSGFGSEEDRRLADAAGCDAHIVKPVDPDVLRTVVRRADRGRG